VGGSIAVLSAVLATSLLLFGFASERALLWFGLAFDGTWEGWDGWRQDLEDWIRQELDETGALQREGRCGLGTTWLPSPPIGFRTGHDWTGNAWTTTSLENAEPQHRVKELETHCWRGPDSRHGVAPHALPDGTIWMPSQFDSPLFFLGMHQPGRLRLSMFLRLVHGIQQPGVPHLRVRIEIANLVVLK
jgi:hypothetical protein